jgi:hypothetical protein
VGQVAQPASGWVAFFVELIYTNSFAQKNGVAYDYHFTTEMVVVPEMLPFEADLNRDRTTDLSDLFILGESWLSRDTYRDMAPRRGGDDIVNFLDFTVFSQHWLEGVGP